jgi:hypothetical protein
MVSAELFVEVWSPFCGGEAQKLDFLYYNWLKAMSTKRN